MTLCDELTLSFEFSAVDSECIRSMCLAFVVLSGVPQCSVLYIAVYFVDSKSAVSVSANALHE